MNIAQDFIQKNNDLVINATTGDFDIGPSDNQHITDILTGWWPQFPLVGAAIQFLLKAKALFQQIESTIKQQLEPDGYQVSRPQVTINTNGNGIIKPNAVRLPF